VSSLLRAAYANFAIQNADCIIAVGTGLIQTCSDCKALMEQKLTPGSRFDDRTTGIVAKYAPKAAMG